MPRRKNKTDSDSESDSDSEDLHGFKTQGKEIPIELPNMDIAHLEELIRGKNIKVYDSECIRKRTNFGKSNNSFKFDGNGFDPKLLLKELEFRSPKLQKLLDNISKLDEKDKKEHGRTFKHFIFSDLKSGSHGSKIIASAFLAKGMTLGYGAKILGKPETNINVKSSITKASNKKKSRKVASVAPVSEEEIPVEEEEQEIPVEEEEQEIPTEEEQEIPIEEEEQEIPAEEEQEIPTEEEQEIPTEEEQEIPIEEEEQEIPAEEEEEQEIPAEEEQEQEETPIITGGYDSDTETDKSAKNNKYGKINLLSDEELLKTSGNNFYLLSSTTVYDQPISVTTKKNILKKYNERPDNVYGELVRFIILDSGFKEGIDLFDVKYVHIFEPQKTKADQKQVIGRATRTCGQKGLVFHPTQGWPLHVFNYDITFDEEYQKSFDNAKSAFEYYLKATQIDLRLLNLTDEMERLVILGSVDYELNKNIHEFSISKNGEEKEEKSKEKERENKEKTGGAKNFKFIIRDDFIPVMIDYHATGGPHFSEINYKNMKRYIHDNFSDYSWEKVKMENHCGYAGPPIKGGATEMMKFTPTQNFISNYFTPENPLKGMLLYQSVGTGKTCTAIATATSSFEKQGYTILWVTRTTLKNDIWKNMFEQSCSNVLREAIEKGEKIPEDSNKRMKMLSKSWKIRPMSYKQFSNLVSKQNNFYKDLVNINGETDPLYKTLLIIDEAHKLYGGGDLSTIEKPDMHAFHQALMKSYLTSGVNSVKLLLMTATPITTDPFELVKLVNLCKLPAQQIPTDYGNFSNTYLNDTGHFTSRGTELFLDHIAGHISYLNRERDARQFSQPIMIHVDVPIVNGKSAKMVKQYDKYFIKESTDKKIDSLKEKLDANNKELEKDLNDLDVSKFHYLRKKCDDLDDSKMNKKCQTIIKTHIQNILKDTKLEAAKYKGEIKTIQKEIHSDLKTKNTELKKIRERISKNPKEYERYKDSTYYNLKFNCSKTVKDNGDIEKVVREHPVILETDHMMEELINKKKEIEEDFNLTIEVYKKKIENTQKLLKVQEINPLDKKLVQSTLVTLKNDFNETKKRNKMVLNANLKKLHKKTRKIQKTRGKLLNKIKKSLIENIKDNAKTKKKNDKEAIKLKKTLRKQGELEEEIKNDVVKDIVSKHSLMIDNDIRQLKKGNISDLWNKVLEQKKKKELEEEKAKIKLVKAEEKERNAKRKENLRRTKKEEKEKEKLEREMKKAEEKTKKERLKNLRKTQKLK